MEIIFKNQLLVDLFTNEKINSKQFQPDIIKSYKKTIAKLNKCQNIYELNYYKGLKYQLLRGNLLGYSAVRLNSKYRLIFRELVVNHLSIYTDTLEIIEISNHYQ